MNPVPHSLAVKKYQICQNQHKLIKNVNSSQGCSTCGVYYTGNPKQQLAVSTIKPNQRKLFGFTELPEFTDREAEIYNLLTIQLFKMEKDQCFEGKPEHEELYDFIQKYRNKIDILKPNYAEYSQHSGSFKITKK